jgi:hypothetical protein
VKLDRSENGDLTLALSEKERSVLVNVLELYPLIPSSYHRLSRNADPAEIAADQKLLDEALATEKQENRRRLRAFFKLERTGRPGPTDSRLSLTPAQVDWLLQVLNDVRVGSWLKLGCPDENDRRAPRLSPTTARYSFALEYCGLMQSFLLQTLDGGT